MPIKDEQKLKEARKRADEKRRGTRSLSWSFIVYPDSAPQNWRDIIDEAHVQWIESPLHDRDLNPTGELKKPHWHILVMFDSPRTYEQVVEIIKLLNAPAPQQCKSARGLVRYMAHMDNPEKHQYSQTKIIAHGGADLTNLLSLTTTEKRQLLRNILDWCIDNDVCEYQDLVGYAMINEPTWFDVMTESSYMILQFIKSRRHCGRRPMDPTTGEIYGTLKKSETE